MTKTLEQLFDKARVNGESNKNGRPAMYGGYGQLQEQWHVVDKDGKFNLRHWGTTILTTDNGVITDLYGESNSDRDALNQAFSWLGINRHAHYYPSRCELELHVNGTDEILQTI